MLSVDCYRKAKTVLSSGTFLLGPKVLGPSIRITCPDEVSKVLYEAGRYLCMSPRNVVAIVKRSQPSIVYCKQVLCQWIAKQECHCMARITDYSGAVPECAVKLLSPRSS